MRSNHHRCPARTVYTIRGVPYTPKRWSKPKAAAQAKVQAPKPKADPLDDILADQRSRSLEIVEKMAAPIGGIGFSTAAALDSVRRLLKDPYSAQFSDMRTVDYKSGKLVCGMVNAKNSYGGYIGAKPFVAGPIIAQIYSSSDYPELDAATNAGLMDACYPGLMEKVSAN